MVIPVKPNQEATAVVTQASECFLKFLGSVSFPKGWDFSANPEAVRMLARNPRQSVFDMLGVWGRFMERPGFVLGCNIWGSSFRENLLLSTATSISDRPGL